MQNSKPKANINLDAGAALVKSIHFERDNTQVYESGGNGSNVYEMRLYGNLIASNTGAV